MKPRKLLGCRSVGISYANCGAGIENGNKIMIY